MMASLVLAALFFAGIHIGVAGTGLRDRMVNALGALGYRIAFALASVAGLAWMVLAYRQAPYIATWGTPEWWKRDASLEIDLAKRDKSANADRR